MKTGWIELRILSPGLTNDFERTSIRAANILTVMQNNIAGVFIVSVIRVKGYAGELLVWESKPEIELEIEFAHLDYNKNSEYWRRMNAIIDNPKLDHHSTAKG
jgi:hypothetical protein